MDLQLKRAKEVFELAIELDPPARERLVSKACVGDSELRGAVDSLLREHDKSGDLLDTKAGGARLRGSGVMPEQVAHYRVIEKVGSGGMGAVWKAEDTQLRRTVALKFLSSETLDNEEVKARLIREAQAAASLDHSNICAVHGIHEEEGETFIAMAYIDGPSLADKIAQRPLPLEEALDIAIQIAEGLQEAHEKGVVHRDIKPQNVMLTAKGQVRIMDFGLAALAGRSRITKSGTMLGTPAYMAPEQLEGAEVDRRADVWAFGCVLYEMLTQRTPFAAESEQAIAHRILEVEPEPVTACRARLPMDLERIIGKALAKDAGQRYQYLEDLLVDLKGLRRSLESGDPAVAELGHASPGPDGLPQRHPLQRRVRVLRAGLAVATVAVAILGWLVIGDKPQVTPLTRFAFTPSVGFKSEFGPTADYSLVLVSPNGRHIAFVGEEEPERVWVRDLNREKPRVLEDTEQARQLFWSPSSDYIGFLAPGELKKVSVVDGGVQRICRIDHADSAWFTWSPDGDSIVFLANDDLYEVNAGGGSPNVLVTREELAEMSGKPLSQRSNPAALHFLPTKAGARIVLYAEGTLLNRVLTVHDLDSGDRAALVDGTEVQYSPTGHLIYRARGDLWALPFSLDNVEATGDSFLLAEDAARPSVSRDGTLVYTDPQRPLQRLVWRDRSGRRIGEIGQAHHSISRIRLSPDQDRVVFMAIEKANTDLWVYNLENGTRSRVTDHLAVDYSPAWSPTGEQVVFSSNRSTNDYDIFLGSLSGRGGELELSDDGEREVVNDWSADGRYILYRKGSPETDADLWYLERLSDDRWDSHPLVQTRFSEGQSSLSPDGRFVAYASNQSGEFEIYVRPFKQGDGEWRVSVGGGRSPLWRGSEVFYKAPDNTLMSVSVLTNTKFRHAEPVPLFAAGAGDYDVSVDGQRVVVVEPAAGSQARAIHVVQNWYEEFRDRE